MYGYICPKQIKAGTIQNNIGLIIGILGFFVMLVIMAIFYFKIGKDSADGLLKFNFINGTLYCIFTINAIYRLFFGSTAERENGLSTTSGKVLATIALALILNLTAVIISSNYLKSK